MQAYIVPKGSSHIDELRRVERGEPAVGPGQVLLRVRAASLNYRDQAVVAGRYIGGPVSRDLIPLSDGAGEVMAIGSNVKQVKVGDRVAATFFQRPLDGSPLSPPAALGSPFDGILAEQIVVWEDGVVPLPKGYSFEEGACLPCAGVTAWHALMLAGRPVKPGDTVLVLGTGGVSILALQLALSVGAQVIATSSSDQKLERVKGLGATGLINYRRTPEWDKEVLRLTGGRGVECVIEVGGVSTMPLSFNSLARGGKVCMIGVLGGPEGAVNPFLLAGRGGNLHGIFVGDREMFQQMNRAIEVNGIKPVVDKVFPFNDAVSAYRAHAVGEFVGKVVITV
jgi:NADPH:quinone reductase-like Zn-dependent oxidoreductase